MDHYRVSIGVRQCQNLFHKLDFRLRKPRPVIAKADEEKRRNLKKLTDLISRGRKIVFLDECHFYQHGTRMRVWIPPEDLDTIVFQEPGRKGISVFGAISINDGRLIARITERYNAFTFMEFLSIVHKKFPHSAFVLDNALYHHASIATDYSFLSQIDLPLMPPYSFGLNPDEHVWDVLKYQELPNFCPTSVEELDTAVTNTLTKLKNDPERIKKAIRGLKLPLPA